MKIAERKKNMYRITTVCRAGVGTSAFAKKLVQAAVDELGYNLRDFQINCEEVNMARGITNGLIVTQKVLLSKMPEPHGNLDGVIGVESIVKDVEALKTKIAPYLEEAEKKGKIHKK